MKKQLLLLVMMLLPKVASINALAHDFVVANADGKNIYYKYNSDGTTVSVSYQGSKYYDYSNEYSGDIVISGSVIYNGTTYSVTSIGHYAFWGCSGLTSVTIPNGVTYIGVQAFEYCGLISLTIPNSVTSIDDFAFCNCRNLTSVTIQCCPTSIGNDIFLYCDNLIEAFFDCETITSLLKGRTLLKKVTINESVTSIGDYAFESCSGLTSMTIPNSVTSIGIRAFEGCSGLTSVTIGNSVTSIGNFAFSGCSGLMDMYCYAENAPTTGGSNAFYSSNIANATLHVPVTSVTQYAQTAPWSGFKSVIALTDSDPKPEPKCATPTIAIVAGKLTFSCETAGAVCHYEITRSGDGNTVALSSTSDYVVSVWATKDGYSDSDVATATIKMLQGDTNGDGEVNVADLVTTTNIIMGKDE